MKFLNLMTLGLKRRPVSVPIANAENSFKCDKSEIETPKSQIIK